jgi:Spy/CpxP family protein refolding chaperone
MKRLILTSLPTLILTFFLSGLAFAQPGMDNPKGDRCINKLDLTKDQETKIEALRIEHQKKMVDMRADLEKALLEKKQLLAKGDYSRNDFINVTNKLSKIRETMNTSRANHQMDIYDLLDKTQKEKWNSFQSERPGKGGKGFRGCGNGPGNGKGFHRGGGRGQGRGMGYRDGRCFK